jgi:hypothetical protein
MFIATCYIVDHYCLWFDRGVVTACYIFISRNPDKKQFLEYRINWEVCFPYTGFRED